MPKAQVSIFIDRPVADVFGVISDYNLNAKWQEGVLSSRQVSEGPPHVGAQLSYERSLAGRRFTANAEIAELRDQEQIRLRSTGKGPIDYFGGYDFRPERDGTRIEYQGEVKLSGVLRLAGKLVANRFASQMDGDLRRLKGLMESGQLGPRG